METDVLTMRAAVRRDYGDADEVVHLESVPVPSPAENDVLVRVRAAGVDRGVWHMMAGLPLPVRYAGFGVKRPKAPGLGFDVAGTVESFGAGVTGFSVGDEVFGIGTATFAEFALCPASKLLPMPDGGDFEQAAVVPISGLTALQAVRDKGRVTAGDRVLVIGAAGGVGSFAIQIATAYGAEVTGVCRGSKSAFVRSLGAERVIDYETEDLADGTRYDVIIDTGGGAPLRRLRRALTPTGTLVIVGSESPGRMLGGLDRQLRAMLVSPFLRQRLVSFVASENGPDLRVLRDLVADGRVVPRVDRTFPLAEAAAAIDYLVAGRARGKIAIAVS